MDIISELLSKLNDEEFKMEIINSGITKSIYNALRKFQYQLTDEVYISYTKVIFELTSTSFNKEIYRNVEDM